MAMDNSMNPAATFKVLMVGDGATGKTTYVKRHITGEFTRKYIPNIGAEVSRLFFHTTRGLVALDVWDTAGQEKFGGLRDAYYIGSHACILFFDVTSRNTYKNVPVWYKDVERVCGKAPTVLVGNKVDVKDRQVKAKNVVFHRKKNIPYFELSAKSNYHIEKPFLYIIRALIGDSRLEIVEEPARVPATIVMDPAHVAALDAESIAAANVVLPPDDDEEL